MKKTLVISICIIVLFCSFTARANEPPNIEWTIEDGILFVTGSGPMENYANPEDAPWYTRRREITGIVVAEGITHIGNLAFYDITGAKTATIADSVKSVGLCAFSYTEGTRTTVGNINGDYIFDVSADKSVVSKGDDFTVSINLTADAKNLSALQTILLFDNNRIAIDEKNIFDEEWKKTIDKTNLGYLSSPMAGIVANNVRLAYISTSGDFIAEDSPLYTKGKTTLTIAKIKCKALADIEDVNSSCFHLKSSAASLMDGTRPLCREDQLTTTTRVPIQGLMINGKPVAGTAPDNSNTNADLTKDITVTVNGNPVYYDVSPYENDKGVIMIPLRHTAEALGATVSWDNDTRIAFALAGDNLSAVQIGQNKIFKNNKNIEFSTPAEIKETRTMVPIDCIEKIFELAAVYDKSTNTFTFTTK